MPELLSWLLKMGSPAVTTSCIVLCNLRYEDGHGTYMGSCQI